MATDAHVGFTTGVALQSAPRWHITGRHIRDTNTRHTLHFCTDVIALELRVLSTATVKLHLLRII